MPTPPRSLMVGGKRGLPLSRAYSTASWRATVRSDGRAGDSPMVHRRRDSNDQAARLVDPISVRVHEAVRMTGLSKSKIYQLIASGDIEAAKVGRATVVFVASLTEFLRSNRKRPME